MVEVQGSAYVLGSGFDTLYGIRDQHILGIRDQDFSFQSGSETHKFFGDQETNKYLGSGIKVLVKKKNESQVKKIPRHDPEFYPV